MKIYKFTISRLLSSCPITIEIVLTFSSWCESFDDQK